MEQATEKKPVISLYAPSLLQFRSPGSCLKLLAQLPFMTDCNYKPKKKKKALLVMVLFSATKKLTTTPSLLHWTFQVASSLFDFCLPLLRGKENEILPCIAKLGEVYMYFNRRKVGSPFFYLGKTKKWTQCSTLLKWGRQPSCTQNSHTLSFIYIFQISCKINPTSSLPQNLHRLWLCFLSSQFLSRCAPLHFLSLSSLFLPTHQFHCLDWGHYILSWISVET